MADFSIDAAQERITDQRTRYFFAEVYSSYANGNYRSAIVMLWSVIVCDLLFKLDFLKHMYQDPTAQAILNQIETQRNNKSRSADWEWILVEQVNARTELVDSSDVVNLRALRDHRHLCAHPVLTANEALYSPSRDLCRAHIRNALDGVLTKPAIMSRKVLDSLLEDIEACQALLPDDESLKAYLNAKYLKNLSAAVEKHIFRSLWRLVFRVKDARCEANRTINFRALCLLYARRPGEFDEAIRGEPDHFSELTFTGSSLDYLMDFLSQHPRVFPLLTEAATTPIRSHTKASLDSFLNAWFLSGSVAKHLASIVERVKLGEDVTSTEAFRKMFAVAKAERHTRLACEIGIVLYGESLNYDTADRRFERFVRPYIKHYDEKRMRMLLKVITQNGQTSGRRRAAVDHSAVRSRAEQVMPPSWEEEFPAFMQSLG